jgi:hypothetical protein
MSFYEQCNYRVTVEVELRHAKAYTDEEGNSQFTEPRGRNYVVTYAPELLRSGKPYAHWSLDQVGEDWGARYIHAQFGFPKSKAFISARLFYEFAVRGLGLPRN